MCPLIFNMEISSLLALLTQHFLGMLGLQFPEFPDTLASGGEFWELQSPAHVEDRLEMSAVANDNKGSVSSSLSLNAWCRALALTSFGPLIPPFVGSLVGDFCLSSCWAPALPHHLPGTDISDPSFPLLSRVVMGNGVFMKPGLTQALFMAPELHPKTWPF